ncbi:MAG: hypothetical protein RIQ63_1263 [Actinomycetota bacterium]
MNNDAYVHTPSSNVHNAGRSRLALRIQNCLKEILSFCSDSVINSNVIR